MISTIIILFLIIVLIQWIGSSPFKWMKKGIYWEIPWPICGNIAPAFYTPPNIFWQKLYQKFKGHDMIGLHFFTTPCLFVRDPKLIKQILITNADSFPSHGFGYSKDDFFARSLFMSEGEEWKRIRSKLTPFFSPAKIKAMFPIVETVVNQYLRQIDSTWDEGPVDVDNISIKLSTDVIVATSYGLKPDSFINPDSFFYNLQKELLGFSFGMKNLIGIVWPKIYRFFNLKHFSEKTNEKLKGFISDVLEARLKGIGVRADFVQGMIELYKQDQANNSNDEIQYNQDGTREARFDKVGVTAQCANMFVAGSDTIGHSIAFLLYELAVNTAVQDKLRKEIFNCYEKNNGIVGYQEINSMDYLNMVVSEGLRKYPAAPLLSRKNFRPTSLSHLQLPSGTFVIIPIIGLHMDANIYPDPDRFDPERFAAATTREAGTYFPFGLGPRTCIGMRLAEIEIKLAISKVLRKYKLTPSGQTPKKLTSFGYGPVMSPWNGLKLTVRPI